MPTYKIRGISVDFPFEAYDVQIAYMEKVIQSLQGRCNALLESPTGTGKTLCLLCATLAWRKSLGHFSTGRTERRVCDVGAKQSQDAPSQPEFSNLPTIVYASRTHSQLRQVIQELKRTNYRPKMVVLGSREQLCVHEDVSSLRGRAQTNACESLCKKQRCTHYDRVAEFMEDNPGVGDEPIDIEDLVKIGKSSGPCPYYVSRDLHSAVDILFAPYNYLIDSGNRKSLTIEWERSIVIFDEAHNLESLCADVESFDLPLEILTACIFDAQRCIDICTARRDGTNERLCNPNAFASLKALLKKLETRILEVPIVSKESGFTMSGPYIYKLLADLHITEENACTLIDTIKGAVVLLEEDVNATDSESRTKTDRTFCRLETMADILRMIFRGDGNDHAKHYHVHIQEDDSRVSDTGKATRTFSWWCSNPGIAMEGFSKLGVGSIILTSGTLSPMDSFVEELKLDFPIRLENPHVISDNQLWAGVVPVGPSGRILDSSYKNRNNSLYKHELGNAIVNFARVVPDGLLVFFPSYHMLDLCIAYWKNTGNDASTYSNTIWESICNHKLPVIEPRQSSLFSSSMNDYMSKLKLKGTSTSGAIFFAVCRGKVSEGLDFADHAGRAVIVIGMPFAPITHPKVRLKRQILDQTSLPPSNISKVPKGEQWYVQHASRAVNQAVGRIIRHKHDYGAIIFCDERFKKSLRESYMSRWIQPRVKSYNNFRDVVSTLTCFFQDVRNRGPTKLKLAQPEDHGTANMQDSSQDLAPLLQKTRLGPACFVGSSAQQALAKLYREQSSSSLAVVKRGKKLNEIHTTNRASLHSYKESQSLSMKHLSDMLTNEKEMSIPGKRKMWCSENTIVDLTGDTSSDNETSRCSVKKPRFSKTGSDLTKKIENTEKHSVVETEPLSTPNCGLDSAKHALSGSKKNAQDGKKMLLGDTPTVQRSSSTEFVGQNNLDVLSNPIPRDDLTQKGRAFLTQMMKKLGGRKYKEFERFMVAMKYETTLIESSLQSVMEMLSTPDRIPLLHRFKDYVPTGYEYFYEEYVKRHDRGE